MFPKTTPNLSELEYDALRSEYADRLTVLRAYVGDTNKRSLIGDYEVLIGELKTLELGGVIVPFPKTCEELRSALRYVLGDPVYFIGKCYTALSELPKRTECDAVRLFDPYTLWNADGKLFDPTDPRLILYEHNLIHSLLLQNVVFDLRVTPCRRGVLPIRFHKTALLRMISERGGRVALSSSAQTPQEMCAGFKEAMAQLRACGFGSIHIRQKHGWERLSL